MPPDMGLTIHMELNDKTDFSDSCIPDTLSLAKTNEKIITPQLLKLDNRLSFSDKVLVWLLPTFQQEVKAYIEAGGKQMSELLVQSQLEFIDFAALQLLKQKLEKL